MDDAGLGSGALRAGDAPDIEPGETYEEVVFRGVDAIEADLRGCSFVACRFEACDLTMAAMNDVSVRGSTFEACRLLGVDVGAWRNDGLGIEAAFRDCDLDHLRVRKVDLRACRFAGGHARRSEWAGVDLREVSFDGVELSGARFVRCDLRGADLRQASGFRIDPSENRVEEMRIALPEALALLGALGLDVDL